MTVVRFLLVVLLALTGCVLPAAAQTGGLPNPLAAPAAAPTAAPEPLPTGAAAAALIRVLEDDAARSKLVEELRRLSAAPAAGGAAPAAGATAEPQGPQIGRPVETPPQADNSLARELGEYTQSLARDAIDFIVKVWRGLANLTRLLDGSVAIDWPRLKTELASVATLALVGFSAYAALRWAARLPHGALGRWAAGGGPLRRTIAIAGAVAIDLVVLSLAWIAAVAVLVSTSVNGRIELIQSQFANAFLLVELVKIGLRTVFRPGFENLRVLPASDAAARYWNRWLAGVTGFLGYGVMLVFPIVNATISFAVGLGVRMVIVLAALIVTIALVVRNRAEVAAGLTAAASRVRGGASSAALGIVARTWHVLVIAYLLVAFSIWVTRPFDALNYMATATLMSAVVMVVGGVLMALMSRGIRDGVRLPAEVKGPLPLLEQRLNLLVPGLLSVLRFLMFLAVCAGVLQAWQLVDFIGWVETEAGASLVGRTVTALVVVVIAMAIWIAATSWIEYRLNPAAGRISTPRTRTLFSLFRNAFTILLVVVAGMLTLSELGVDIAPLIAGAGVLGLAIGIGSQKLVQDIITGAFIQFENAMNEGDVVTVAGISGVVERLTIRSVGLRDVNGVYHVIPFSSVDLVSNAMRGFAFHVADVSVSYREDVGAVKRLMAVAFDRLMTTEHAASVLEPLEMNGIVQFLENAVVVRARIKTLPGQQWPVGRAYSEHVKAVFDEAGIRIPVPHTALVMDRNGSPADDRPAPAAPPRAAAVHGDPARPPGPPARTLDVPDSPEDAEAAGVHR